MPLLAVGMPANVIVVFRGLSDVINLDILDKQTLYNFTFGRFVPNQILEGDQSQRRILRSKSTSASAILNLGYAQQNAMRDLLVAGLVVMTLLVLISLVLLVRKLYYNKLPFHLKRTLDSIRFFFMWDKVLSWTTETYLSIAIGTLYAVKTLNMTSNLVLKITIPL